MMPAEVRSDPVANVEGEYALIAALLFNGKRIDSVADVLTPEQFFDPFFGRLFGLLVAEHARGNTLGALTLRPLIEADPGYQALGGMSFLADLTRSAAALLDVRGAARQVVEFAKRRQVIEGLRAALATAADTTKPIAAAADEADAAIAAAAETASPITQMTGEEAMMVLMREAETPSRSVRSRIIPSMDDLLGGMRPKQLVIGAGRPGMGKTAAALSYALGAAQAGHGVLFVSLEMSAKELAARVAADLAFDGRGGVPYAEINADQPSKRAWQAMEQARGMLADLPFSIVDAGSLTLGRLDMLVRRYRRRMAARGHSLDLVVVDYLQLLRCDDKRSSAYEAVSEISRRLKATAKDHDVALLALAQLSRKVEERGDKRPQLSDLRDSGQIEQDADAVLFLYRPEYYLRQSERADPEHLEHEKFQVALRDCEGKVEFICAKRRNGCTGTATGRFHAANQAVRG